MKHIRTLDRCILRDDVVINLIIEIEGTMNPSVALPAPYPCSRLSLKARRPRPQLQFKHLILRVCQSAGGRAFNYSFIKVHFEFVSATLLRCQMSQCLNVSM